MRLNTYVRLRPVLGADPNGVVQLEHRVLYIRDPARGHTSEYCFDQAFDHASSQADVYTEVGAPLVDHVLRGYNACCFAFGQTGSGKTHSLYGREGSDVLAVDSVDAGIIPRACEQLWRTITPVNKKADNALYNNNNTSLLRMRVFVSCAEVYLEQIRDLGAAAQAHVKANQGGSLPAFASADGGAPTRAAVSPLRDAGDYVRTSLDVVEDASGSTFVKDLTYVEVSSLQDTLALLRAGYLLRASPSSTSSGDCSPRSHTVFTVTVVQYRGEQQPLVSRLNLVDLAGSEKAPARGGYGGSGGGTDRQKELRSVQASLTALGKVLQALTAQSGSSGGSGSGSSSTASTTNGGFASASGAHHGAHHSHHRNHHHQATGANGAPHVPYRDSKLTRLLKDSLAGGSHVSVLACLHPAAEHAEECAATLQWAVRAANLAGSGGAPVVNVLAPGGAESSQSEQLIMQVQQLKEELEATHAHYQKLLENVAGPSWRSNPGPVERAPGGSDFGGGVGGGAGAGGGAPGGMDAFAAALSGLGRAGPAGAGAAGAGGGMGSGGGAGGPTMSSSGLPPSDARRQTVDGGGRRGGKSLANGLGGGVVPSASGTNARVSLLEAQIRKMEGQLAQARATAQQYEERLTQRKEEMDLVRERMAGKEHAQFAEIKKLRQQVADLTKALDAERADGANKLEDMRRRGEEDSGRLMKDIDVLRSQLAQVTGSVSGLMEKHSAAITAEKKQREALARQTEKQMRNQAVRGTEEHRAQVENLKQQSSYFMQRQAEQLTEVRQQLDALRAEAALERDTLTSELDYLAQYAERVTEVVRRMESGVVPVHERGGGLKAFRLPPRERPPRLDGSRLVVLRERNAELADRLAALSAATSAAPGTLSPSRNATPNATLGRTSGNGAGSGGLSAMASAASLQNGGGTGGTPSGLLSPGTLRVGSGTGQGGGGGLGPPGAGGLGVGLGSSVDLDVLRAQVEAELRAQVTAQVLGDMRSDKTVEYIRELEVQVARYRSELQAEKRRSSDMNVALRAVQRAHQRPHSPMNKALAAHTPAGTLSLAPSWGLGHGSPGPMGLTGTSRPATAGLVSLGGASGLVSPSGGSTTRRPSTSYAALTSSFRDNGIPTP